MTGPEYEQTLDVLTGLCRTLRVLDIHGALASVGRAQTLGPILDPTGYGPDGGGDRLHDAERLLRSALQLQQTVEDLARAHTATRGA